MSSMLSYNAASGISGMLKEGTRHQQNESGDAAVVLRNIDACLQLSRMLTTSLGPQGRCKLVVNHMEKIIVTADCASILKEVQIEHPAANLLAMAVKRQEEECGDATNLVLSFAGELLWQTALLISNMTWQPAPEILAGYQQSMNWIEKLLPLLTCHTLTDLQDKQQLLQLLKPVLQTKQNECQDILAPLVADACLLVAKNMGKDSGTGTGTFPVDAIRTVKIIGASVQQSRLVPGYVAIRGLETVVKSATNCKVAVYATGIEAASTEAKGTVVMKTAHDLKSYNASEEVKMQEIIQGIANAGVTVIVTGGNVSDMALHFMDRYKLVCLRIGSKWELRRLCQAVNATALVRLGTPLPEEMGFCNSVGLQEIGDKTVTVFTVGGSDDSDSCSSTSKLATIILRASTSTVLSDLERAVDDGVHAVSSAYKDAARSAGSGSGAAGSAGARLVHGGGSVEMALATLIKVQADKVPGLEQYAMNAFCQALKIIPRTLAENAGHDPAIVVANLQAAHAQAYASAAAATAGSETKDSDSEEEQFLRIVQNYHCNVGIDIETKDDDNYNDILAVTTKQNNKKSMTDQTGIGNMEECGGGGVVDLLSTKLSAMRLAVDAVITILKIDQIIMSKPSGGPKG